MKILKHIIHGWWLLLTSNKEANKLASERSKACDGCGLKNNVLNICNDCGCFLPAKQRVKDAQCPIDNW